MQLRKIKYLMSEVLSEMKRGPEIICLCGSTKFKDKFMEENRTLTLNGYIVLMPGCFGHTDGMPTEYEKGRLDRLHLAKIDLSDMILVINVDDYIGRSTAREILYAEKKCIRVKYAYPFILQNLEAIAGGN